jgi:hypothetical protein
MLEERGRIAWVRTEVFELFAVEPPADFDLTRIGAAAYAEEEGISDHRIDITAGALEELLAERARCFDVLRAIE